LIVRYWRHVEEHYRHADGTPTTEVATHRRAFKHLRALFESLPAAEFGPLKLKDVRARMIEAGWVRTKINSLIRRIVRMFKWGVEEELIADSVYGALRAVSGLQKGRCKAAESEPVMPVDDEVVEATLPYLGGHVRAMVELQRATGARPGEVCGMRGIDLDMSGTVWVYRPAQHKTAHHGKRREVFIGPKGQAILSRFLTANPLEYIFSPAKAVVERWAMLRANRKTKVQPSQKCRKKRKPCKKPGDRYVVTSYNHAVRKACERADYAARLHREKARAEAEGREPGPVVKRVGPAGRIIQSWHPNRLRHKFATEVRRKRGLEAAQVLLGHSKADTTQIYAERDRLLALQVAAEVG
jgi:integrase